MAHSDSCCCLSVMDRRSLRLDFPLGPASQGTWTSVTDDFLSVPLRMETYVNVFRWDVLFVLHKLRCWVLFKCFKFSLCWRSLFLSLVWQRYLERGNRGQWHLSCFMFTVNEDRMEPELSPPQPPAGLWKHHSLSFFLSLHCFPSLYGCHTMISSEGWTWTAAVALRCGWWRCLDPHPLRGQSRGPIRQRWNRLPALSALKCSLTSHPDSFSDRRSPFHSVHYTLPEGKKKIST